MTIFIRTFMTALFLFAGLNIHAQVSAASTGEDDVHRQFSDLRSKSWKIRQDQSYRETSEIVYEDKSKNLVKQVSIFEFVPPDRRRYSTSMEHEGKTTSYESITIGEQIYFRENKGKWTTKKVESRTGTGAGSSNTQFIEKTTIDGRSVIVFEDKWTSYFDEKSSSGTTRYWFAEEGYLLKSVEKKAAQGDEPATTETNVYEYDPKIKIETPIVK